MQAPYVFGWVCPTFELCVQARDNNKMDGGPLLEAKDAGLVRKRLSMHVCMDPTLVGLLVDIFDISEALAFGLTAYYGRELNRTITMGDLTVAMIGNLLVMAKKPKREDRVTRKA